MKRGKKKFSASHLVLTRAEKRNLFCLSVSSLLDLKPKTEKHQEEEEQKESRRGIVERRRPKKKKDTEKACTCFDGGIIALGCEVFV